MVDQRRPLIDGLKPSPSVDPQLEKAFVYGASKATVTPSTAPTAVSTVSRVPISTRIRADFVAALKRASLERQLNGVEPNTLQDMLEQAIEPWLKANGYLSR
jgi:hypothetical protein